MVRIQPVKGDFINLSKPKKNKAEPKGSYLGRFLVALNEGGDERR